MTEDRALEFESKLNDLLDEYLGKKVITADDAISVLEMAVVALRDEADNY